MHVSSRLLSKSLAEQIALVLHSKEAYTTLTAFEEEENKLTLMYYVFPFIQM